MTDDIADCLELAGIWKKTGTPPCPGGSLDQTAEFVAAFGYIVGEQAAWMKEKGMLDLD